MDIFLEVLKGYLLPCVYAYAACAGFCVIFHIRGKLILFAPIGGALGWLCYLLTAPLENETLRFFLAAMALAVFAEIMARVHRVPVTCYLLVALLPLVPGGGIYYTMEHCINGETSAFLETGLHTLGLAGALALGVVVVSSIARLGLISRLSHAFGRKGKEEQSA